MPDGLKRYQTLNHDHLITISCYNRRPYLRTPESRDLFEQTLERARQKFRFSILAYVVMPEHVHLLLSEPPGIPGQEKLTPLAKAMHFLKLSVSKQSPQRPFWHVRYHDFNVFTQPKRAEKIRYLHHNPCARGLAYDPADWPHSSARTYLDRQQRAVTIAL